MRLAPILVIGLCALPTAVSASEGSRFSGEGRLFEAEASSADGRFSVNADLMQTDHVQSTGRFALDARLMVSDLAKSTAAVCGTVSNDIFKNSFE